MVHPGQLRRTPAPEAALVAVSLAAAFAIGYWNQEHARITLVVAGLPLVLALITRPRLPLLLGIAALPLQLDAVGGSVHLTVSDLLMTLALVGALPALLLHPAWRERHRGVGALMAVSMPFVAWLVVVAVAHPGLSDLLKTGQYYQLFFVPLLLGALVLDQRSARIALGCFIAVAVVLAVLWAVTGGHFAFAGNKNPSGQFMADAAIIALPLAPTWPLRLLALMPLAVGLGFTQSRGAIIAAGVGIVVVLALRGLGSWRRTVVAVVPLVVVVVIGYQLLPEDVAQRNTDFSAGGADGYTAAQYSVHLREVYKIQGWQLVDAHPVFGVGPGNYLTGTPGTDTLTTDPHDLVIRTAGDVGYPGLVAFGFLVVGSAAVAAWRIRVNPYAAVAVAVQAALVTHGFLDVYWVRGTPVIGWLLVGMAVNRQLDSRRG